MKELTYSPKTWRKMRQVAKKIDARHANDGCAHYIDGSLKFGNNDRKAERFSRLLAWLFGQNEAFGMFHPTTGEMRRIFYRPTGYHDCSAGFYIEQE
jgi:hypothetical protein